MSFLTQKTAKNTFQIIVLLAFSFFIAVDNTAAQYAVRKGGRLGKKITITTKDKVRLSALYFKPASTNKKTLILQHGLGSNQEEWQPFANKLVREGCGFLSYDARGHGESTFMEDGSNISYTNFGPPAENSNWEKMVSDLDDAVNYLVNEKSTPAKSIGLMGASLGANTVILYAAVNKTIPFIILLSPGLNYAGLQAIPAITEIQKRPVLLVASPNDTYAYQSTHLLNSQIKENKRAVFYYGANGFHGVQMLNKSMTTKILMWIGRR